MLRKLLFARHPITFMYVRSCTVTLKLSDNGYFLTFFFKEFTFSMNMNDIIVNITMYITNYQEWKKEWYKKFIYIYRLLYHVHLNNDL